MPWGQFKISAIQYKDGPVAIRYPRGESQGLPLESFFNQIPLGKSEIVRKGHDFALFSIGDQVYQALKIADDTEKKRINGIIHDHEAKKYIRLALSEINHAKQDKHLGKAIESLEEAARLLKESGDGEQCDFKTCEGCMHLFKGLKPMASI